MFDVSGSSEIHVSNLVMRSSQADGINLHGKVSNATVVNVTKQHTAGGDFCLHITHYTDCLKRILTIRFFVHLMV